MSKISEVNEQPQPRTDPIREPGLERPQLWKPPSLSETFLKMMEERSTTEGVDPTRAKEGANLAHISFASLYEGLSYEEITDRLTEQGVEAEQAKGLALGISLMSEESRKSALEAARSDQAPSSSSDKP